MRANFILLAPIACFVVDAAVNSGKALAQADPYRPVPGAAYPYTVTPGYTYPYTYAPGTAQVPAAQEPVDWGPARSHPHDYPGPPLRGGNGGG